MEKSKNVLEMKFETNCMPWQTAEGDQETLIILRKRISVAPREIKEIHDACISSFEWTVVSRSSEGCICKGNIGLVVNVDINNTHKTEFSHAVGEEENVLQDYLREDIRLAPERSGKKDQEDTSSFSSILVKEPSKTISTCIGDLNCELPWQSKVYTREEISEPRIMLVHLFLEGISTILIEVLLKLEGKKPELHEKDDLKSHLHFFHDEGVLVITGDKIQEAIALVGKRSFKSIDCGPTGKIVRLKAVIKYTLVYLSANKGGARIQMVSCYKDEERRLKAPDFPLYQPAELCYCLLSSVLTKIDSQKSAFKIEYLQKIFYDLPDNIVSAIVPEEKKPAVNNPFNIEVYLRKKPGEKWLKEGLDRAKVLKKNKTVMCIKLNS